MESSYPALHRILCNVLLTFKDETVGSLERHVRSGEYRDFDFTDDVYAVLFELMDRALAMPPKDEADRVRRQTVRELCLVIIESEEFYGPVAAQLMYPDLISTLVNRANPSRIDKSDIDRDVSFIESALSILYRKLVSCRSSIRAEIGKFLHEYSLVPTRGSHLTPILHVLTQIVSGMSRVDRRLFIDILLPLHKPNGFSLWDRQTPIIAEYHKALTECCYGMVTRDNELATLLVNYLLSHAFPQVNQTNTAKDLLLMYEISEVLPFVDISKVTPKLMHRLIDCIPSENAQVAQSALVFWKSPPSKFPAQLEPFLEEYMGPLLTALFRGSGEAHWNPTVNKMTLLVLESLESARPELFRSRAELLRLATSVSSSRPVGKEVPRSLAAGESLKPNQPALGITGVAPWHTDLSHSSRLGSHAADPSSITRSGLDALREYTDRLRPTTCSSTATASQCTGRSTWEEALSCETPTLLPDLKFHNLVFGRDLGVGAFSTVRYARVVRPKSYLSQWDEVAVKVISYDTIKRQQYGESVVREISCLRNLAHPSIARLISDFRWRDGVYLVLEYGSLGDLHTYVGRSGGFASCESHGENMARILIGEIATALATVHEAGFVYGDLKPENVVITATKHVKLADFGACRPYTLDAHELVVASRETVSKLRSGDWKAPTVAEDEALLELFSPAFTEGAACETTYEGTSAYLPPEIVLGSTAPSVASDAWALGMTLYYILKGRLPSWVNLTGTDSSTTHFSEENLLESDELFSKISDPLKSLLLDLLVVDPVSRASVESAIDHPWFADVQDVRSLYKREVDQVHHLPLAVEGAARREGSEGQWEKRQLSKVWTAQPRDYALGATERVKSLNEAIPETYVEEGSSFLH